MRKLVLTFAVVLALGITVFSVLSASNLSENLNQTELGDPCPSSCATDPFQIGDGGGNGYGGGGFQIADGGGNGYGGGG